MTAAGSVPSRPPEPDPGDVGRCPFVGLVPFREADERFFFGRDRERDLISANLASSRLTILYGRSGVGKTSVLRAGVLPQAWRESEELFDDLGTPGFITAYARQWSIDAEAAITQAVRAAAERTPGARPIPASPAPTLATDWFSVVVEGTGCAGIRLILDQFEEYFLYHPVEPESGGVVDALAALVRDDRLPVHVLLSLREESLASLDRFKGRMPNLFANVLRLAPLTARAARDAVVKPVEAYNALVGPSARMSVQPELLDDLLFEVQQGRIDAAGGAPPGPGAPAPGDAIESPYLQLVMTRLWAVERAGGSQVLRRSTLEGLGGAQSIVRGHLDEVMKGLSAQDQDLAATLFHHMVTATGAKVALTVADLAEWTGRPADVQRLLDVLGAGEQFIVRKVPPPQGVSGPDRYEIYHDVLALAVADWRKRHDASRSEAQLVQERQEALAQASAARRRLRRTRLVAVGLGALVLAIGGLAALALKLQGDVRQQQALRVTLLEAEQMLDVDPTQSLRIAVGADEQSGGTEETSEAVLKASGALRYEMVTDPAWCQAEQPCGADRVLVTAAGTHAVVLDTSGDALRLTKRAIATPATGQWLTAAVPVETLQESSIIAAAVNDDATLVGVLTWSDGFVVDTATGESTQLDLGQDDVLDIAFLPGGDPTRLVVSGWGGIEVLDAAAGRRLVDLDVVGLPWPTAVVGGSVVALDHGDRTLKVWGADGSEPLFESDPIPDDVPFDQVLLAAAPGLAVAATGAMNQPMTLIVWRWEEGPGLGRHEGSLMKVVNDVSIDDSQRFVTVAVDKSARQFDLRKSAWRAALPAHADWVNAALTTRRGKRILTAGADGRIYYWSTVTPWWSGSSAVNPVYELLGHAGAAEELVAVGPEDRILVSTGSDRTARIWRLPETRRYEGHRDWVIGLEAATGESCRAVDDLDGDECLLTVSSDRAALHRLQVQSAAEEVDFSTTGVLEPPEGRHLRQVLLRTSQGSPQAIVLYEEAAPPELWRWDPDTTARLVREFEPLPAGAWVDSLSLSDDGSMVVAGDNLGRLHAWDVETGEREEYEVGARRMSANPGLAYDPTGAWVALSTDDGVQVTSRDGQDGLEDLPCPPSDPWCTRGALHSVFSRDGSRLAVSNRRGDIHVWDRDRRLVAGPLSLPGLDSSRPALSADGRLLAAGAADGLIQVWDVGSGRVIFRIRRHADSVNAVLFAERPGEAAGADAAAPVQSLLVSVSDDTTAAVISCPPCADAARAIDAMRAWVASHPGEGPSGRG
jgi:WD40 repeat protein